MRKNVAGQFVGAEVIAKADGTPVTSGTTTVSYVGDNGSYTTGSVGSGAATHKGGGYWEYAPSQGETNFDHVAFTFVNTNGINPTVQIYTSFPQTGDNFARLGAPVGASISADIAANLARINALFVVRTNTVAAGAASTITLDGSASATDNMYQDLLVVKIPSGGVPEVRAITAYVGSTKVATVDKAWTVNPTNTDTFYLVAGYTAASSALTLTTKAATNLGTFFDASNTLVPTALLSMIDQSISTAASAVPTAAANATAVLAGLIETGLTLKQALGILCAVGDGKSGGATTGTETYRNAVADTKVRVTATVDANGNWTGVAYDLT